ncbi:hypothetical protein NP493_1056g01005 [Ridgeia piscesae]|uniref:Uncharacterized protein n=1 Tax=Ridgeia piscesae TaxID=27915 RepID=A0AAD9NIR3_RIDPI|nr:hypothetical protein NP493_1056g01005 [Ridgeia piscesae]
MAETTLALVLGDSHVCWLERFVSSSGICFETGSSFVGTDCHFKFAGFRGGHVSSVRDDSAVDRLLELQMPNIAVLCLGGNDVYGSLEPVLTVETWLWFDTVDIIAVKRLMLAVIKLLKGYKEQCVTAEARQILAVTIRR